MKIDKTQLTVVLVVALLSSALHFVEKFGVDHQAWAPYLAVAATVLGLFLGALRSYLSANPVLPIVPLPSATVAVADDSAAKPVVVSSGGPDTKKEGP